MSAQQEPLVAHPVVDRTSRSVAAVLTVLLIAVLVAVALFGPLPILRVAGVVVMVCWAGFGLGALATRWLP